LPDPRCDPPIRPGLHEFRYDVRVEQEACHRVSGAFLEAKLPGDGPGGVAFPLQIEPMAARRR